MRPPITPRPTYPRFAIEAAFDYIRAARPEGDGLRRSLARIYSPPDGESPDSPGNTARKLLSRIAWAQAVGLVRALVPRRLRAGAGRGGRGGGRQHARGERPARNCTTLRRRVLGSGHLHDADVDDRGHWLR